MAASTGLPPDVDRTRLTRGCTVFLRHALPSVVVSSRRACLAVTGRRACTGSCDLPRSRGHPYQRLMGVVQLLVNVSDAAPFEPEAGPIITAQKLRLLHAGIRPIARSRTGRTTGRAQRAGEPRGHAGHHHGLLLARGGGHGGSACRRSEARPRTLYCLWREFARLMGIHPGAAAGHSLVPADLGEAARVLRLLRPPERRRPPDAEPDTACVLTQDNLDDDAEPPARQALRRLGLGLAPRIAMTDLMAPENWPASGSRRCRVAAALRAFLHRVLALGQWAGRTTRSWRSSRT